MTDEFYNISQFRTLGDIVASARLPPAPRRQACRRRRAFRPGSIEFAEFRRM